MDHHNDAWQRAFIATTVAIDGASSVDDALRAISGSPPSVSLLVAGLRSPQKSTRAAAMAEVLRDVMIAIDEATIIQ